MLFKIYLHEVQGLQKQFISAGNNHLSTDITVKGKACRNTQQHPRIQDRCLHLFLFIRVKHLPQNIFKGTFARIIETNMHPAIFQKKTVIGNCVT